MPAAAIRFTTLASSMMKKASSTLEKIKAYQPGPDDLRVVTGLSPYILKYYLETGLNFVHSHDFFPKLAAGSQKY